jgi:ATP/maltotriose-dependent transcriptional regulator MalT
VDASQQLQRGRDAFARQAWSTAAQALERADAAAPLAGEDVERLATTRYMRGDQDGYLAALQHAYRAHADAGAPLAAARCAGWLGMQLFRRGEIGAATGWMGRAQRLLDEVGRECVERAYLTIPRMFQLEGEGRFADAAAVAAAAQEAGRRHGDADLVALAGHSQGQLLVLAGEVEAGLALLDEAMIAVTAGELSPIVRGIVYCGVISGCHAAFDMRRAHEWTSALTGWCAEQPDLVAFTGACLVHRAEILQIRGAWPAALEEARRAGERCAEVNELRAAAHAAYLVAELHRLRGSYRSAEQGYVAAARGGYEPQPGLARLRLAQGDAPAAAAALSRALGESADRSRRAALLPACVDVQLALGDIDGARRAGEELEELCGIYRSALLTASAEQARGAVDLAGGDAQAALPALRRAWRGWQEVGAPYEGACVRELTGQACAAVGDADAAAMELDAAREAFAALGAAPDVARLERLLGTTPRGGPGLTARELQVLRLVAGGGTNRAIAAELVLSEKTVDRHVSNILGKLRVPSRAAATAYAYEHELL